jgi:hypothetical protein
MIEHIARYVGAKVLTTLLVVVSIIVVIWYWRLTPEARADLWGLVRGGLIWLGFVLVLPWALFFVPARVARADNNAISAVMLLAYVALDIGFAFYLTSGHMGNAWQAGAMLLGFACAAAYNFVVCEYLADRLEDAA